MPHVDCKTCNEPNVYTPQCATHNHPEKTCPSRTNDCYRKSCDCNYQKCRDKPSQCKGCSNSGCCTANCYGCNGDGGYCKKSFRESEQKKIWNQVRVPSTLYMMNRAALNVFESPTPPTPTQWAAKNEVERHSWLQHNFHRWNQMSDRLRPAHQVVVTPTRGNSTRSTVTAHRPGAGSPGGKGVDVKHDSYARYLAKKKGKILTKTTIAKRPIYGNKIQTYNIINKNCCPKLPETPCDQPMFKHLAYPTKPCNPCENGCCPSEIQPQLIYTQHDFDNWLGSTANPSHAKLVSNTNNTVIFTLNKSETLKAKSVLCISPDVILKIDEGNVLTISSEAKLYNGGLIKIHTDKSSSTALVNKGEIYNCGLFDICLQEPDPDGSISTPNVIDNSDGRIYGQPRSIQGVKYIKNNKNSVCQPCHLLPENCQI